MAFVVGIALGALPCDAAPGGKGAAAGCKDPQKPCAVCHDATCKTPCEKCCNKWKKGCEKEKKDCLAACKKKKK